MPNKYYGEFNKFKKQPPPAKDTRGPAPTSFGMPMKAGGFPGLPGKEEGNPFPSMGETGKFDYAQKKGIR